MFVGEIIEISADENIKPLIYHNGRYRQTGEDIPKPSAYTLVTIEKLAENITGHDTSMCYIVRIELHDWR